MKRFCLKISYDGSGFSGWQIQPERRTVQEELQKALAAVAKTEINVIGSGRTDSGVHALAQFAHFDCQLDISPDQMSRALNSLLPADIRILGTFLVPQEFHARFKAYKRTYRYLIAKELTPFNRNYASCLPRYKASAGELEKFLERFLGEHDFSSFSKFNPEIKSTNCTVTGLSVKQQAEDIAIDISANRFLHNMVRRLVGTSLNLITKGHDPEIIADLLAEKDPAQKEIYTAPPQGLYLLNVYYPSEFGIK